MPRYRPTTATNYRPGGEAAATILRTFLAGKTSEDGSPLTNQAFALSIGLGQEASRSQVSHWLRGDPISPKSLLAIIDRYPDFPLLRYMEASSRIEGANVDHIVLAVKAVGLYERHREEMYEMYQFMPPESLARGQLASLANPSHDFEQELLADRANDRPISSEERQRQVRRFREAKTKN